MRLDHKRVLVTGAGSGIGRALAVQAAQLGMEVAICGRRLDALKESETLFGSGTGVMVIPADLTNASDRGRIAEWIGARWGHLDVLVNNAGVVHGGPLEASDDASIERVFQTNVMGPMSLTRELMPLLAAAAPSCIVNVGSMFGDIPYAGFAAYSASKFALRGFSIALRRELKDRGIRVTYAAPRATHTDAAVAFKDLIASSKMRLDAPEDVAARIWRAVSDDAETVYPPGPERFYVLLQRVFPRLIDRALAGKSQSLKTPLRTATHEG